MALYVTQGSKFHIFLVDYLLETSEDFLTGHEKLKNPGGGGSRATGWSAGLSSSRPGSGTRPTPAGWHQFQLSGFVGFRFFTTK